MSAVFALGRRGCAEYFRAQSVTRHKGQRPRGGVMTTRLGDCSKRDHRAGRSRPHGESARRGVGQA